MKLIEKGYDEINKTEFILEEENGGCRLTIPMPIGIGADVIHVLSGTEKLNYKYNGMEYISKQIQLMQASPEHFKIVSWR